MDKLSIIHDVSEEEFAKAEVFIKS